MLLDNLLKFEWYNDPLEVNLSNLGMEVVPNVGTDFCACPCQDNGHFFFCKTINDFCALVTWQFDKLQQGNQCGIMARIDSSNWIKTYISLDDDNNYYIKVDNLNNGKLDSSSHIVLQKSNKILYQIELKSNIFSLSYSPDEMHYHKLRELEIMHPLSQPCQVGAYICNQTNDDFSAILLDVELK